MWVLESISFRVGAPIFSVYDAFLQGTFARFVGPSISRYLVDKKGLYHYATFHTVLAGAGLVTESSRACCYFLSTCIYYYYHPRSEASARYPPGPKTFKRPRLFKRPRGTPRPPNHLSVRDYLSVREVPLDPQNI